MTNYEYSTGPLGLEGLAQALCDMVDHKDLPEDYYCCELCIAKDHCTFGHKGFIDWLMEEHK